MTKFLDERESMSPHLFAQISEKYLQAAKIIWEAEFANRHRFYWDKLLILRPLSQLVGVSLETSLKGLIACRGIDNSKTHSISKLFEILDDPNLEAEISALLQNVELPEELVEVNEHLEADELAKLYRTLGIHVDLLDRVYDRPYVSRYPYLGSHAAPDIEALMIVIQALQLRLREEKKTWHRD